MKKVHLLFCIALCVFWFTGIKYLIYSDLYILILNNDNTYFFTLANPYNTVCILLLLIVIPVEPVMLIITLIIETLQWTKKSFLTIVVPFIITFIMWWVYLFAFVGLTGGV